MSKPALTRSINDRVLAGVIGGIARRFGWNPTWTRVGYILLSILSARLVQEGRLAYEAPVSRYWPEFAAAGKADVTVGEADQLRGLGAQARRHGPTPRAAWRQPRAGEAMSAPRP